MSFVLRLLRRLRPSRYVGKDIEGNLFYEHPGLSSDPRRTRRSVKYRDPEDVWRYIGGGKRLAVQWSSWLSHTRQHPPTLQELQLDLARQQRVLANATLIEARDREERLKLLQTPGTPMLDHTTERTAASSKIQSPAEAGDQNTEADVASSAQTRPRTSENALPKMASQSGNYEPGSWIPHARTRSG